MEKHEDIKDVSGNRVDVFKFSEEFPDGYEVWAIGRENFPHERCVPLCQTDGHHFVKMSSLKYVIVESEELALKILNEAVLHVVGKRKFSNMVAYY